MIGLPNPYVLLAGVLVVGGLTGGAYLKGKAAAVEEYNSAVTESYRLALASQTEYTNALSQKLSDSAAAAAKERDATSTRIRDYETSLTNDPRAAAWATTPVPSHVAWRLCQYKNPTPTGVPSPACDVHKPPASP